MLQTLLEPFKNFINWFTNASMYKKLYIIITLMAFGLYQMINYYDKQLRQRDADYGNRITYYIDQLEKCHKESRTQSKEIITILQKNLRQTDSLKIESEKLKLEIKRLELTKKRQN